MSLTDALVAVSGIFAVLLFSAAATAAIGAIVTLPIFAATLTLVEGLVWPRLARLATWWLASLVALVLLVWIDGNFDPWWPR